MRQKRDLLQSRLPTLNLVNQRLDNRLQALVGFRSVFHFDNKICAFRIKAFHHIANRKLSSWRNGWPEIVGDQQVTNRIGIDAAIWLSIRASAASSWRLRCISTWRRSIVSICHAAVFVPAATQICSLSCLTRRKSNWQSHPKVTCIPRGYAENNGPSSPEVYENDNMGKWPELLWVFFSYASTP